MCTWKASRNRTPHNFTESYTLSINTKEHQLASLMCSHLANKYFVHNGHIFIFWANRHIVQHPYCSYELSHTPHKQTFRTQRTLHLNTSTMAPLFINLNCLSLPLFMNADVTYDAWQTSSKSVVYVIWSLYVPVHAGFS